MRLNLGTPKPMFFSLHYVAINNVKCIVTMEPYIRLERMTKRASNV